MKLAISAKMTVLLATCLVLAGCGTESRATKSADGTSREVTSPTTGGERLTTTEETKPVPELKTAENCSADELNKVDAFVKAGSWTKRPDEISLGIVPDPTRCVVRVRTDQLNAEEEQALRDGGGPYIVIERVPAPKREPLRKGD